MEILKAEGIEELSNDEKAALVDVRPKSVTVAELLDLLALPLSTTCCASYGLVGMYNKEHMFLCFDS